MPNFNYLASLSCPWHEATWVRFSELMRHNRYQQLRSMLVVAEKGSGVGVFAIKAAQYLLCLQRKTLDHACGSCQSCTWFTSGSHPDFIFFGDPLPNTAQGVLFSKTKITIDEIRQCLIRTDKTSIGQAGTVVVLPDIDFFSEKHVDALLKSLEDSSDRITFLLTARNERNIPLTIKSRTQQLTLLAPSFEEKKKFLQNRDFIQNNQELEWFASFLYDFDYPLVSESCRDQLLKNFTFFCNNFIKEFHERELFSWLYQQSQSRDGSNKYFQYSLLEWQLMIAILLVETDLMPGGRSSFPSLSTYVAKKSWLVHKITSAQALPLIDNLLAKQSEFLNELNSARILDLSLLSWMRYAK